MIKITHFLKIGILLQMAAFFVHEVFCFAHCMFSMLNVIGTGDEQSLVKVFFVPILYISLFLNNYIDVLLL